MKINNTTMTTEEACRHIDEAVVTASKLIDVFRTHLGNNLENTEEMDMFIRFVEAEGMVELNNLRTTKSAISTYYSVREEVSNAIEKMSDVNVLINWSSLNKATSYSELKRGLKIVSNEPLTLDISTEMMDILVWSVNNDIYNEERKNTETKDEYKKRLINRIRILEKSSNNQSTAISKNKK